MTLDHPSSADPRDQELTTLRQRVADMEATIATHARNYAARDQELVALRHKITELEATIATHAWDLAIGQSLRMQLPDSGIVIFDSDLRYLVADVSALAQSGLSRAGMVGHTIWEVWPLETAALLDGPYRAALRGEPTIFSTSLANRTYCMTTIPVRAATGQIIAGMAVITNITAQATTEQQLQLFAQIVEYASDGIMVRQTDQTITYANPAMKALLGQNVLEGTPLNAIIAPQAYPQMVTIGEQLEAHHAWSGRLVYQRADGITFPGRVAVFPLTNATTGTFLTGIIVRDVTAEEQAEQEQHMQILAAQQAIIRELATPLIPLASEVIAMPLVGTIDTRRAQQIMETLLEGIVTHQATYAILDITGIKTVDTQVAHALVRIAQAAKLLGAQMLLSGIGAEIALTLTHLGTDVSEIIPVANLQAAITYALAARSIEAST